MTIKKDDNMHLYTNGKFYNGFGKLNMDNGYANETPWAFGDYTGEGLIVKKIISGEKKGYVVKQKIKTCITPR